MQIIYAKARTDKAHLLLQNQVGKLLVGLPNEDRKSVHHLHALPLSQLLTTSRLVVDYFHDFYRHSFALAKHWPLASPVRTLGSMAASPVAVMDASPNFTSANSPLEFFSPSVFLDGTQGFDFAQSPAAFISPSACLDTPHHDLAIEASRTARPGGPVPSQFCRWSIHLPEEEEITETMRDEAWDVAPVSWHGLPNQMSEAMTMGTFSDIAADRLPIDVGIIARSIDDDPSQLRLDSWKLAIMSGNVDLLNQLLNEARGKPSEEVTAIHPLHLAAAFLDGSRSCCNIFQLLLPHFGQARDEYDHTVFDALMITILRSHTNVSPLEVNYEFRSNSFPGEESDVCGRWNTNSPAVINHFAQRHAQSNGRAPAAWKHCFCHTSVQAICHNLITFGTGWNLRESSGLFRRLCTHCGLQLKLGPLHTVAVLAFFLADRGMEGETLFGALAVTACLLVLGVNPSATVDISFDEIIGSPPDADECRHGSVTALELMMTVPRESIEKWTESCQTGWTCILETLKLARDHPPEDWSEDADDDDTSSNWTCESSARSTCPIRDFHDGFDQFRVFPCVSSRTGKLWAWIQVEFLTHRRVQEDDHWLSKNFSMTAVKCWLQRESETLQMPLARQDMAQYHTPCGWFLKQPRMDGWLEPDLFVSTEDVCKEQLSNMHLDHRTSYIHSFYQWGEL